jgi:hypothetical protein
MSYDVLQDRMFYGLKKVISDNTNISAFSEHDTLKGVEYVLITNGDLETGTPGTGSSTFVGVFNIDFYTNNKNQRTVRNQMSKLTETLADVNHYQTATISYFFNGQILNTDKPDEDDKFAFRVVYQITHEKVR